MAATPSLSVFFPADNDAGTIASLVINDGSQNDTPRILDELARVYPGDVRIVHHQQNRGGGALRSGFATASKDRIFRTVVDVLKLWWALVIRREHLRTGARP